MVSVFPELDIPVGANDENVVSECYALERRVHYRRI